MCALLWYFDIYKRWKLLGNSEWSTLKLPHGLKKTFKVLSHLSIDVWKIFGKKKDIMASEQRNKSEESSVLVEQFCQSYYSVSIKCKTQSSLSGSPPVCCLRASYSSTEWVRVGGTRGQPYQSHTHIHSLSFPSTSLSCPLSLSPSLSAFLSVTRLLTTVLVSPLSAVRGQTLKEKKRLGHRDRSGLVEEVGVHRVSCLFLPDVFPYELFQTVLRAQNPIVDHEGFIDLLNDYFLGSIQPFFSSFVYY